MQATDPDTLIDLMQLQRIDCFVRETELRVAHLQAVLARQVAQGESGERAQAAVMALQGALEALRQCHDDTTRTISAIEARALA
jgi:hypothetical protein